MMQSITNNIVIIAKIIYIIVIILRKKLFEKGQEVQLKNDNNNK